jgi:hypothetical protein
MFRFSLSIKTLTAGAMVALLAGGMPHTALAKTYKVDCTKNGKLQSTINSAVDGDAIEITGICQENIVIRDKRLTLVGASTPGPHGITGVAPLTDALHIQHGISESQQNVETGTVVQGLTISNPHFTCVRITFQSLVEMTDVKASDCGAGAATGIWVQEGSRFFGLRLTLNNNLRGFGATQYSRAICEECDLNGNVNWAASSWDHSTVSLLDSAVNGTRGLQANQYSYIDIDCPSVVSEHVCHLNATAIAGQVFGYSTVAFYGAGEFSGRFQAFDRSQVQLLGARQQSGSPNLLFGNSSLRVEPFFDGENEVESSRLQGETQVNEFSQAVLHGDSTVLDGSLFCSEGGDASVDGAVDLTGGAVIDGCDHAPTPCVPTDDVEYIISGGPEPDAGIYVDDILEVFRDAEVYPFAQVSQGGGCCQAAAPIRFRGNTEEEIRVVARDGNDCYSLRALYLQKADGTCLTQLSDDIWGPNCGSEPPGQTFFDQTFVLP